MSLFAYLMFWPTQSFNVGGHDSVAVGVKSLRGDTAVLTGAYVALWLLSVLKRRNKELMLIRSIVMTIGTAGLTAPTRENLPVAWGLLVLGGLGMGGVIVPASTITTFTYPDDLIATVSALTLFIRCIGGCIGHCAYHNVFFAKFVSNSVHYIRGTMTLKSNIANPAYIKAAIETTGASLIEDPKSIPGIAGNEAAYEMVVLPVRWPQQKVTDKFVYLASVAAGVVSVIATYFLVDIDKCMETHVLLSYLHYT